MSRPATSLLQHPLGAALIILAAAVRLLLWARERSFWIDEARLSLNIATRSYLQLLPPLDYDQTAPLLYLWLQRSAIAVGGVNELSLRSLAVVAGVTTVALVYRLAGRLFGRRVAVLSCAMATMSPTMIYFSNEAKQYAVEACISCALMYLGVRCLEDPSNARGWRWLITIGVGAIWLASPAVFVLAAFGFAVLGMPSAPWRSRLQLAGIMAVCWGGSLMLAYAAVYGAAAHDVYLKHYWSQAFLALWGPHAILSAGVAASSVLLGPIARDRMIGSTNLANVAFVPAMASLIALAVITGVRRLVRTTDVGRSALVLAPPILVLTASLLRLYPISVRTTTFYLPTLIILIAAGTEKIAGRVRSSVLACAVMAMACAPLAWISYRELTDPDPGEHIRPLIELLQAQRRAQEPVYVFAGAIPAWAIYTTDWRAPDIRRLDYLRQIARAGGPAFENAPSRGRSVVREGDDLAYLSRSGLEIYGIPDGLEARVFGLTNSLPDSGWAENEARRIRDVANPGAWLMLSHFFGPEGQLLDALEVEGGRVTFKSVCNGAALFRYEFPGLGAGRGN